ncbi:hypothetical protein JVU11DRAFT_4144 [Chiua virens]|nr:hypothetical protein JVU11DRAFT_4144 [Chiua virens]
MASPGQRSPAPYLTYHNLTRSLSQTRPVTALFGQGDDARRTLVHAWLDDARCRMPSTSAATIRDVLHARLQMNEPVLAHLPEVRFFVPPLCLSSPHRRHSRSSRRRPTSLPLDPTPVLAHAARVADQACWVAEPHAKEMTWYTRRATVSGIYLAAELHQFTSPNTATSFLDDLLANIGAAETVVKEVSLYGSYILDSWKGIAKSRSIL